MSTTETGPAVLGGAVEPPARLRPAELPEPHLAALACEVARQAAWQWAAHERSTPWREIAHTEPPILAVGPDRWRALGAFTLRVLPAIEVNGVADDEGAAIDQSELTRVAALVLARFLDGVDAG